MKNCEIWAEGSVILGGSVTQRVSGALGTLKPRASTITQTSVKTESQKPNKLDFFDSSVFQVNSWAPARVKFAWFRLVQKCTFSIFNLKVFPPREFSPISYRQNRLSFHWWFLGKIELPVARDGQKTQGRFDRKNIFFSSTSDINNHPFDTTVCKI